MINKKIAIEDYEVNSYIRDLSDNSPEIYFSHANGFNALSYSSLLKKINKDYQVISYDMRGHGLTTLPANPEEMKSWFVYKDDLEKIIKNKKTPSILIGHSMGGTASLLLAYARPDLVSRVILIDPVILSYSYRMIYKFLQYAGLMKIHPMVKGALMRKNSWESHDEAIEYFKNKKLFKKISESTIKDYVIGGLKKNTANKFELNCHPEWEAANFKLSPDEIGFNLKKSQVPIKLILTPHSLVCNKRSQKKLKQLMPQIEIVNIENTTHMLPLENNKAVSDEINKFLT